jgi:hypothetical protein
VLSVSSAVHSGLIYEALGLPVATFPVMFDDRAHERMDRAMA